MEEKKKKQASGAKAKPKTPSAPKKPRPSPSKKAPPKPSSEATPPTPPPQQAPPPPPPDASPESQPPATPSPDRVENGRFALGNGGGPGGARPGAGRKKSTIRALEIELAQDEATLKLVWAELVYKATTGDIDAIKYYLDRALGKVPTRVETQTPSAMTLVIQ